MWSASARQLCLHTHFKHPVQTEDGGKSLTNLYTYVLNHKMEISKEKKRREGNEDSKHNSRSCLPCLFADTYEKGLYYLARFSAIQVSVTDTMKGH